MGRARFEEKILGPGRSVEHPGHPLVVALFIMEAFPSLDAALAPSGTATTAALTSELVPGARSSVSLALTALERVASGQWDELEAVMWMKAAWAELDNQRVRYPDQYRAGEAQALELESRFLDKIKSWPPQLVPILLVAYLRMSDDELREVRESSRDFYKGFVAKVLGKTEEEVSGFERACAKNVLFASTYGTRFGSKRAL